MRKQTLYTAAALVLAAGVAGCSKNDIEQGAAGTGTVALSISATRANGESADGTSSYNPLDYQTIRIYNALEFNL